MAGERVLGVDACKGGWVGVAIGPDGARAYTAVDIGALMTKVEEDGAIAIVGVDMPIGLPDCSPRGADVMARLAIGPRWQAVFMTPIRKAMEAPDFPTAIAINKECTGKGFAKQAWALKPKLFEVERWLPEARCRVVEVHPEVSFAELAGGPLTVSKSTWAGVERRRRLLAGAGIDLVGDLGEAGRKAGVDDVLDAGAAAWSARRVARGEARPLPDQPETFSDGLPCAIWF